ncbi:MAG: FecR family protein [Gemmatimonadales bacterium]
MRDHTSVPEVPSGLPDWEALARYLTGESTAEEAAAISQSLAAQPRSAGLAAALARAMERIAFRTPAGLDVEGALRQVHVRMNEPVVLPLVVGRSGAGNTRQAFAWRRAVLGVAATLVVAAGVTLWRQNRSAGGSAGTVSAERVFVTDVGKRDSTRLPDGSRVLLGPGSRLTIAAGFAEGRREVVLLGDAHFEVKHDVTHPFAVRALDVVISDIGTAFAVHGDRDDGVLVSVSSGAVELKRSSNASAGVRLGAGDLGVVDPAGAITVQRGGASAEDTAWTQGRLVFRNAPLAKVRADLRRWYGVELVSVDSALSRRHVTASFLNDSKRQVLKVITLALGASYEMHGDTVLLHASATSARTRR